ncbi:long-chain fatty acid--CoA ligase [Amycolatopsis acidicola]|uniref:Long-chain fatty acid--CoA ligase n=1 Tax=Amycolatopsis acidicola TaxID=2596893 RepID=A0A5N0V5W4_9PSEU|nr:AMP-binding protein [Amycolatopsis acidicola]KAA9160503.1 long-chain fatty acid--CoA ligase [Amycolatopsis acidicola]
MPTIGAGVLHNAARVPDRPALITPERRWTWRELDDDAARTAARLRKAGLGKGDRFAIVAGNRAETVVAFFAAARLGAIVVPVNARLAAPEIAHILADAGPVAIASAPELDAVVDEAVTAARAKLARFSLGAGGEHPDPTVAGTEEEPVYQDFAAESDDALILYTSGTTGRPKGVLLDHHRAIWAALAQVVSLGLRDGERYLHLPPLYHAGGVVFLNAITLLGGTHVLIPAFDPGVAATTIERERISAMLGVPTMYQFLLRHPGIDRYDLSSWRTGIFGAAPMPAETVRQLLARFPGVTFFQQCGQTEAGPTGLYSTYEQIQSRPDSSGHLAQPFVEARLVDENGADVAPGEVGELVLRGEPVMKGYWHQPEATAEAFRGGWLHTGDLMHLHEDGAMRLVDRLKDVIITGGRNVYSAEVEQALASHPDVADCAVVGVRHPDWNETIVAVVTPVSGRAPTLESIREHCRARIADYKLPRELRLAEIPRTPSGKIQKHLIRKTFSKGQTV